MSDIKQHTIRLPAVLFNRIVMRAVSMGRSVNKEIEMLLQRALEAQEDADKKAAMAASAPAN